ncbi:hypothetical protein KA005_00295, partial [bacterium]|nr:hypothetical protein [bacterium]
MMSFARDNDSQDGQSLPSDLPSHPEFEDMTKSTSEGASFFAFREASNLVKNLRTIIPQIENPVVADQLNRLLVSIRTMIEIAQRKRPDLNDILPL